MVLTFSDLKVQRVALQSKKPKLFGFLLTYLYLCSCNILHYGYFWFF